MAHWTDKKPHAPMRGLIKDVVKRRLEELPSELADSMSTGEICELVIQDLADLSPSLKSFPTARRHKSNPVYEAIYMRIWRTNSKRRKTLLEK